MDSLFPEQELKHRPDLAHEQRDDCLTPLTGGRAVSVAINANLWGVFDYHWPDDLGEPFVGQRVKVSFGRGNKTTLGFITNLTPARANVKLKQISEAVDTESVFDENSWSLAQWVSRYYLSPLGMVLATLTPASLGIKPAGSETIVKLTSSREDWPASLGCKQKKVLDELLQASAKGIDVLTLKQLKDISGSSRESITRLAARDLLKMSTRIRQLEDNISPNTEADKFCLNPDQQKALDSVEAKLGRGFSVSLLHGVTGSGKTEVYVRAFRKVVAEGKQCLLLVPEIALATQTMQRLIQRLEKVAVLHSGLTAAQRSRNWDHIRHGRANIIIGPRSAVFAPARKLGLIIVDEEHESSYKQDTSVRYHARDVAVKRASIEQIPIVLGSATPSLESFHNVHLKRYEILSLPQRVRGLAMPSLQIVHLRQEIMPGRVELIGKTLTNAMASTLDKSQQIILLMNRRGFASMVFCPSCQWTQTCDDCTRAMVFHQATRLTMCHYCQRTSPLPDKCPACGGKILLFGMGIQRIEGELARKFPAARIARMDSDTMTSPKQFQTVFDQFGAGEIDILLGTQMVAKGLDFPGVSLVGIISADTSLIVPDFRASERTFQLVVQVAGRAGRSSLPGTVVVQTLYPDEPAITLAVTHDYISFAEWELPAREQTSLPPFTRMVRFIVKNQDPDKACQGATMLHDELALYLNVPGITLEDAQPAGIKKIKGMFRFQVVIISNNAYAIQKLLLPYIKGLRSRVGCDLAIDVDPINLT